MDANDPTGATPLPGTIKPQRRYTDDDAASALAVLAENGGNILKTSRETGIPRSTLREWRDGTVYVPPAEVVMAKKAERAARWDEVQDDAISRAIETLPEVGAYQAALIGAIAVDKAAVLRGEATAIIEHRDDERTARLRELYAKRAPVQVQAHTTTALPAPTGGEVAEQPTAEGGAKGAEGQ